MMMTPEGRSDRRWFDEDRMMPGWLEKKHIDLMPDLPSLQHQSHRMMIGYHRMMKDTDKMTNAARALGRQDPG